jgi:hypothetical protein
MSRAFLNEDAPSGPERRFSLPPRDAPDFDEAAASTLLEAAREGATGDAEEATGYRWGEPRLVPHVKRILARARKDGDDRLIQLAERYLG